MKRAKQIAIINYGAGNLGSVTNALEKLGYEYLVTSKKEVVLEAHAVIFPGVGAAAECMARLLSSGLAEGISRRFEEKRPIFAICIGMQVLFSSTEEGGLHRCLEIIPGSVKLLPPGLKIPHMGWNQVKQHIENPIFDGITDEANFYFVHSYYADPREKHIVAGTTDYGVNFCSMIIKDNLIATQFHPEKSGSAGLKMYANFLEMSLGME